MIDVFKNVIVILLISFVSLSFSNLNNDILEINADIENIYFEYNNYNFPNNFDQIDILIKRCNNLDYLIGESVLLDLKIFQAVAIGSEDALYDFESSYKKFLKEARELGIRDKELYYELLILNIQSSLYGFDINAEKFRNLFKDAIRVDDYSTAAYILYQLWSRLESGESSHSDIEVQLDTIFEEYPNLKESVTYVLYSFKQIQKDDKSNNASYEPLISRSDLLLTQARQFKSSGDALGYEKSLELSLQANEIQPNHVDIISSIVADYLWLHILKEDTQYLDYAEKYNLEILKLYPQNDMIHYNMACIYSQKNNIEKSKLHLKKSLELGKENDEKGLDWMLEDPDLENLRKVINMEDFIEQNSYKNRTLKVLNEALGYAKAIKFEKYHSVFEISASYIDNLFSFSSNNGNKDKAIKLIEESLHEMKNISMDVYLRDLSTFSNMLYQFGDNEKSKQHILNYIDLCQAYNKKRERYLNNLINSSTVINHTRIVHDDNNEAYYSQFEDLEQYYSVWLKDSYEQLAWLNLEFEEYDDFFVNMEESIKLEEKHDYSVYAIMTKYLYIAGWYRNRYLENESEDYFKKAKYYILKVERQLNKLSPSYDRTSIIIELGEYYSFWEYQNPEKYFTKIRDYLLEGLEQSRYAESYLQEYKCLLELGDLYHSINSNEDLQYQYYLDAYSLIKKYDLSWSVIESNNFFVVLGRYKEYDKIEEISKKLLDEHILNEDIEEATNAFTKYYLNVWWHAPFFDTIEDAEYSYDVCSDMIEKIKKMDNSRLFKLRMRLLEWRLLNILNNVKSEDYKNINSGFISQYISIKDYVLEHPDFLMTDYLWLGKRILSSASLLDDEIVFNKVLNFIEPIHFEYGTDIQELYWFIDYFNGAIGPYNEELYDKYIGKVLSFPVDEVTLPVRAKHGYFLCENLNKFNEGIKVLEQALNDSKDLDLLNIELDILMKLSEVYNSNNNYEIARKRAFEARDLSKKLNDEYSLETISVLILDQQISSNHPDFYDIALEYYELGLKYSSTMVEIQGLEWLIDYFIFIDDYESAISYMLKGFDLKERVIKDIDNLSYLNFSSEVFDKIFNEDYKFSDLEGMHDFINNGTPITDSVSSQVYDELMYFINYDFKMLRKDESDKISERPLIYRRIIDRLEDVKQKIDENYFIETEDFNDYLLFMLNLDNPNFGGKSNIYLNLLGDIRMRIYDIEYYSLDNMFFGGFGFRWKVDKSKKGLELTSVFHKSPASNLLKVGDIVLADSDEELSHEIALEFLRKKLLESDALFDVSSKLSVLRDDKIIEIEIMAGDVQPNPCSKNPRKEMDELMSQFLEFADYLLKNQDNIRSSSYFTSVYRDFIVEYPVRYFNINNEKIPDDILFDLINRYEDIATTGFIKESLSHKEILNENPLLISEYQKQSRRINKIQLKMQNEELSDDEKIEIDRQRIQAYNSLNYFEQYRIEKTSVSIDNGNFVFSDHTQIFNQFDAIFRDANSYYEDQLDFIFSIAPNSEDDKVEYYPTSIEKDFSAKLKIFNQGLQYNLDAESKDKFLKQLIDLTKMKNNGDITIFPDEFKDLDLNILVVPEGQSNFYPYELMLFKYESDTTAYHYFGEIATFTYTPSLSAYVDFVNREPNQSANSVILASANPDIEPAENYLYNNADLSFINTRSDYGNIENVDNEIVFINETLSKKKEFKDKIVMLDSKSITEDKFKREDIEYAKYIHIAAHGIHTKEDPLYSGVLLGRADGDEEDGLLQAHEIFPLNLNADLVTLSTCFSGFGEIDPNEGNLGIYRSFLLAGAKSVIISLWDVDDKSTSIFFGKFYEFLADGYSKSKSLQLAKNYLREETEYSHPFYWAPFILMGES
tara:strand:- start:324 stop:5870 length:5547 start_codon:yes stop_codon:yes gene_type:complete